MLELGSRRYELVRAQSGFCLALDPRMIPPAGPQRWRFEAHYVPADDNPGRDDRAWEYLRLAIWPDIYTIADWRDLSGFDLAPEIEAEVWHGVASAENLLAGRFTHDVRDLIPGDFAVRRAGGYLFSCTLDGSVRDEQGEEPFHLEDEIPFAQFSAPVAINAADPVKAALALSAREINLTEYARSHVTPYDWREKEGATNPQLEDAHEVTLVTPWQRRKG